MNIDPNDYIDCLPFGFVSDIESRVGASERLETDLSARVLELEYRVEQLTQKLDAAINAFLDAGSSERELEIALKLEKILEKQL